MPFRTGGTLTLLALAAISAAQANERKTDSMGNAYMLRQAGKSQQISVTKLCRDGRVVWSRTWQPSSPVKSFAFDVQADGSVAVAVLKRDGTAVRKYGASGDTQWTSKLGVTGRNARLSWSATGDLGFYATAGAETKFGLLKSDSGTTLWSRSLSGTAQALGFDPSGKMVLMGSKGSLTDRGIFVDRFTGSGEPAGHFETNPSPQHDRVGAMVIDGDGNAFVATANSKRGGSGGEVHALKIRPDATLEWEAVYPTVTPEEIHAQSLALRPTGNLVLSTYTNVGSTRFTSRFEVSVWGGPLKAISPQPRKDPF